MCSGSSSSCGHLDSCASCASITIGTDGYYALTQNYEAVGPTDWVCLDLYGENGTLDLNGHFIRGVVGGGPLPHTAIRCQSPGMRITDSSGTGSVNGFFYWAGIRDCSVIDNVTVDSASFSSVWAETRGLRSLADSTLSSGLYGLLESSASRITGNYILDDGNSPIHLTGMVNENMPGKARVSGNVLSSPAHNHLSRIITDDDVQAHVGRNLISGNNSDCYELGSGTTSDRLYCDCSWCTGDPAFDFPSEGTFGSCPGQLSSGNFVSGVYTLTANLDLASTTGECIKVVDSNKTIELNGYTIYNSLTGGTGIRFTAAGGTVRDTAAVRGGIKGAFAVAVQDARVVTGVQIDGATVGLSNANSDNLALDQLTNTVVKATDTAVSSVLLRRASFLEFNALSAANVGLNITGNRLYGGGTGKVSVESTVVRECSVDGIRTASGNASYSIIRNSLHYRREDGTVGDCLDFSDGTVFSKNLCNCGSGEGCEGYYAPMTLPLY